MLGDSCVTDFEVFDNGGRRKDLPVLNKSLMKNYFFVNKMCLNLYGNRC